MSCGEQTDGDRHITQKGLWGADPVGTRELHHLAEWFRGNAEAIRRRMIDPSLRGLRRKNALPARERLTSRAWPRLQPSAIMQPVAR